MFIFVHFLGVKPLYADKGLREEPTDERILKIAELIKTAIPQDQKELVGKYIKSIFEILKKKEIITDEDIKVIKEATEVDDMATALEVAIKKRSKLERQAGIREGIREGKREGLLEGKIKIAKKMLKMGQSPEMVIELTELPEEEINKLIKEIEESK